MRSTGAAGLRYIAAARIDIAVFRALNIVASAASLR
jgi:hypothetical protein